MLTTRSRMTNKTAGNSANYIRMISPVTFHVTINIR
nr:MAG TPA: hypothetical protein [Caudoviricetes sp.]